MYNQRNFNGPRGGSGGGFAPVKVGQEIDVKIEAVGQKGDGIAKEKGFVLFIPGAKENDEVKVKITKVLRNVGFAEVVGQASEKPVQDSEQPSDETPVEDAAPEPVSEEDSEDFGEELDEEKKE